MDRDLDFIIHHKLMAQGPLVQLNTQRKTMDNQYGRYLPLFSKLKKQAHWISTISKKYREDIELFGYSYFVNGTDVYATCKQYDRLHICI